MEGPVIQRHDVLCVKRVFPRRVRERAIDNKSRRIAIAAFLRDYEKGRFNVMFPDREIIIGATRVLLQRGARIPLRTLDAIQLEYALRLRDLGVTVVSDVRFKASIKSSGGIEVFDPEVERWSRVKPRLVRRIKTTE